jgi:hypothetical protein
MRRSRPPALLSSAVTGCISSSGQAAIACLFAHPGRAGSRRSMRVLTLAGAREQRVSAQPTIVVDVGVGSAPR